MADVTPVWHSRDTDSSHCTHTHARTQHEAVAPPDVHPPMHGAQWCPRATPTPAWAACCGAWRCHGARVGVKLWGGGATPRSPIGGSPLAHPRRAMSRAPYLTPQQRWGFISIGPSVLRAIGAATSEVTAGAERSALHPCTPHHIPAPGIVSLHPAPATLRPLERPLPFLLTLHRLAELRDGGREG